MAIDTTEHLRAAEEGIRARLWGEPSSTRLAMALEALLRAQQLWADAIAPEPRFPDGSAVTRMTERRRFAARRVRRGDAGGKLWAPVDQHGVESGDTPSYDGDAIQRRCDELNKP